MTAFLSIDPATALIDDAIEHARPLRFAWSTETSPLKTYGVEGVPVSHEAGRVTLRCGREVDLDHVEHVLLVEHVCVPRRRRRRRPHRREAA